MRADVLQHVGVTRGEAIGLLAPVAATQRHHHRAIELGQDAPGPPSPLPAQQPIEVSGAHGSGLTTVRSTAASSIASSECRRSGMTR